MIQVKIGGILNNWVGARCHSIEFIGGGFRPVRSIVGTNIGTGPGYRSVGKDSFLAAFVIPTAGKVVFGGVRGDEGLEREITKIIK